MLRLTWIGLAALVATVCWSTLAVGDALAQSPPNMSPPQPTPAAPPPQSKDEACRNNVNSEECICWNVNPASTKWVVLDEVDYQTATGWRVAAEPGTALSTLYLSGYVTDITYTPRQYPGDPELFTDRDGHQIGTRRLAPTDPYYGQTPEAFGFGMTLNVDGARQNWHYRVSQRLVENHNYKRDCAFTYLEEDLRRLWQIAGMVVGALLTITVGWAGVVHMQETASGNSLARTRAIITRAVIGAIIVGCCYMVIDAINVELFGVADFWWTQEGELYEGIINTGR